MSPDAHTINEQFLDVGDGHSLYIQDWGNAKAKTPIIFLHGGPGSQVKDKHRRVFDPSQHRVIFFDQRGSGKSLPYGSIENNTTQDQINDIEKIAHHFGLIKFGLVGGSWGCCLALAYALEHSQKVSFMVLSGIWTASQSETDFVDKGGFRKFFPDIWDTYLQATPKGHHKDPSAYHFKRALGNNEAETKQSCYAYENLEGALLSLDDRFQPESFEEYDPTGVRIEIHYLSNHVFLPDNYILDNALKLHMPIWLVQGRYDMVCPPITAYELSKKLPNNYLIWTVGGHKAERESWNVQRTVLQQWD